MKTIPKKGLSKKAVREGLAALGANDFAWRSGRSFAYTFDAGKNAEAVAKSAFGDFMGKNALDPTFFPSVLELENQIVSIAASHLSGDDQTVGAFTSGGTESIILAVKTARDYFRRHRPDIEAPEMVLPVTAHAAFHKAAHYLGVRAVVTGVDPVSLRADPEQMRAAVTPRTILLVGSATSYAHGVVDPIPALGRLAQELGLLLHVDGCIGAFLLPYFERFGAQFPAFDFSVPGVTSISMDLHKYCYAPKGASVVLYKSLALRRHQIFACAGWTGYTMVNTTVQSTKSAGPLAGAWAVLHYLGDNGYERIARELFAAKEQLIIGIRAIPQLRLLAEPDLPLLAFTSDEVNVFEIIDHMAKRGWHLQAQLCVGDIPENIHLSVNPNNCPHISAMLEDLHEVAAEIKKKPRSKIAKTASSTFGRLNPDRLSDGLFAKIIRLAGIQKVGVPERMADINEIMNLLPPRLTERLLGEYINRLFVHPGLDATLGIGKNPHPLPGGPNLAGDQRRPLPAWANFAGLRQAYGLAQQTRDRLAELGLLSSR